MLWLIQRDFLHGASVQQMVAEALAPVPNPDRNADIEQVGAQNPTMKTLKPNSRPLLAQSETGPLCAP